ncbi:MAG TPA: WhiB family transcriptional regulator [Patescibacteria group bacterium]|jgi:WhiB family redox-sensing transcriptional regulator|nr:WhiB family transcriptional regulator [Patescibacteria group bacterium]
MSVEAILDNFPEEQPDVAAAEAAYIGAVSTSELDISWKRRGACRGIDPDLFYPVKESDADDARQVCSGCPVREQCLEYALAANEKYGVWGGTSERERRRILRYRSQSQ